MFTINPNVRFYNFLFYWTDFNLTVLQAFYFSWIWWVHQHKIVIQCYRIFLVVLRMIFLCCHFCLLIFVSPKRSKTAVASGREMDVDLDDLYFLGYWQSFWQFFLWDFSLYHQHTWVNLMFLSLIEHQYPLCSYWSVILCRLKGWKYNLIIIAAGILI